MFEGELRAASIVRASKPCKLEGEALTGERREPAPIGTSTSLGRGTELGVSEDTPGSGSSSETDSSASSSSGSGTGKLKPKPGKALTALRWKASYPEAHKVQASSFSSAITPSLWPVATSFLYSNFLCGFINRSKSRPLIGVATSVSTLNDFFRINHTFLVATSLTVIGDVVTWK